MSNNNGSRNERYATATRAVRAGIATDAEHGAVVPPIHLSSTFAFEGFGRPRTYDYTRSGNPTRTQLADALAQLEGGSAAVVTSTGMSAVLLALQFAKPGDLVLAAHDCYGGTQRLLRALAGRGHFDVVFADLTQPGAEAEITTRKPKVLWVETPSNPLLRITDVRKVCAAARTVGALSIVDNTFLSPALQQPLALGADLVVHSTTKYLNGHSDVVGGAVIAHDATVGAELAWWANCLGITGAPFDSFLTLRGVRTLFPRIAQHVENAQRVVEALSRHEAVACVHYPGLPSHPGHELAKSQQSGFGAMVSFEIVGGTPAVEKLVNELRCFTLAESLGGVESLVAHPATMTHASMDAAARASAGITDSLLRLSVGIEDGGDLVRDLTRALDRVASEFATPPAGIGRHRLASVAHTDVVLLGAGAIGRELISQIGDPGGLASARLRVCGVIDRSGYLFNAGGLSGRQLRALREHKAAGGKLSSITGAQSASTIDAVDAITRRARGRAILVDATAAETTPALELALGRGWDLVLANKVPLAADRAAARRLLSVADEHGREILHEATVGAGLPVIDTLRKLIEAGDSVLRIEGCPSGTLGFLFGELGSGQPFSRALRSAIAAGYTEPDPRIDLSGLDVARKALILGRIIGFDGDLADVAVESLIPDELSDVSRDEFIARLEELDAIWRERVSAAQSNGTVLRYRASVTPREISVGLVAVTARDPLGSLNGTDNQFAFTTTRYRRQPLVITGPGAGAAVTAAGVLNDLLRMASERGNVGTTSSPGVRGLLRPSAVRLKSVASP